MRQEYTVYESDTGRVIQVGSTDNLQGFETGLPEGFSVLPKRVSLYSKINLTTLEAEDFDPGSLAAEWGLIKQVRDQIEVSPIEVSGLGAFDVDDKSLKRMEIALTHFDDLPTLTDGQLAWKLADNTFVPLTSAELQTVYDEVIRLGALRAADLHVKAEQFRVAGKMVDEIKDWTAWGY